VAGYVAVRGHCSLGSAQKRASKRRISAAKKRRPKVVEAPQGALSVKQICRNYLVGYVERTRTPKGTRIIQRIFDGMLSTIEDLPAESISRGQAFDLLNLYANTPSLAKTLRGALGAAWDYAIDSGKLPETTPNWWRLVLRGKLQTTGRTVQGERVTAKRILTDAEIAMLIPWLPNISEMLRDVVTLYLWTGTRGAEIVAMKGAEITEESDGLWWTIPKAKTKNAKVLSATDHRVPLVGRAEEVVRRRMAEYGKGYFFPGRGTTHNEQKSVQQGIYYHQPYCPGAPEHNRPRFPVTHWAPHDLRRTVRTKLAAIGCPHEVAEALLGHVLPGVAGIYNRHNYDKERRLWLTRLAENLESLLARSPS
jgi:integrase